ncbi:hypothetical protein DL93DRAFT_2166602 [Clavulina sp. PMI_390]|nr:hypothetical protein DL93DRAFT_2166602 [Clavulina sp. PMI_390]
MTPTVDILILGAGWTGEFLIPLLQSSTPHATFSATTRDGRVVAGYKTTPFDVSQSCDWRVVPKARTIILMFPTEEEGAITNYVHAYEKVHGFGGRWLQLGSTSAWNQAAEYVDPNEWITRRTHIPRPAVPRVESEIELLSLSSSSPTGRETCVLNLAGLWGHSRSPRNWVVRIAPTKDALRTKGALHMIHGDDVARAIVAIHQNFSPGQRWLLTDTRVYDWWDLAGAWGSAGASGKYQPLEGSQAQWVLELMKENEVGPVPMSLKLTSSLLLRKVYALPRPTQELPGKHLSSTEFWEHFGIVPWRARLEE